ncbi:MAG: hypothetical protein ACOCXJ_04230, partial [Planctomycetota bacterium]
FDSPAWAHDAAGDHIDLHLDTADGVLEARHRAGPRGQGILRREVSWDLSRVDAARLRVHYAGDPGLGLALGLRSSDKQQFDTALQPLQPGWNELVWPELTPADAGQQTAWQEQNLHVTRLMVLLAPQEDAPYRQGRVLLDRLALSPADGLRRDAPTEILDLSGPEATVPVQGIARWQCRLRFHERPPRTEPRVPPLLRHMSDLVARVVAPDGSVHEQRGFCTGIAGDGTYAYELRLRPWMPGTWQVSLGAEGSDAPTAWSRTWQVQAVASDLRGPVQVDAHNPHYFATGDDTFFWPLGQNLSWAGDHEPWLDQLQAAGGNWTRVWLCAWGIDLNVDNSLHQIDFEAAAELDRLFTLARERGIQVQLVVFHHGLLGWDWARNPFNAANGGSALLPEDFWTDWRSKALVHRLLDYLVARYGAHPNLFAWEFWNEADLADHGSDADIIAWHRDMADHLRERDIHDHMLTTSTHAPYRLRPLFADGLFDFEPAHRYHVDAVHTHARLRARPSHIPRFLAEFGSQWREELAAVDDDGIYLRQGLFSAWCQGLAGACMPWWWDVSNREHDLLRHLGTLRAFAGPGDFRHEPPRIVRLPLGDRAVAQWALQGNAAWGYICDPRRPAEPNAPRPEELLPAGRTLTLHGLLDGTWQLSWWTGSEGVDGGPVQVHDHRLQLELPAVQEDLGIRLLRSEAIERAVTTP